MVEVSSGVFSGFDCVKVANRTLSLWVTKSVGPRVIGLLTADGENNFAVLPGFKSSLEDGRDFSFRGGHRLWTAPEVPPITYLPDDDPVRIDEVPGGIRTTQPLDEQNGIQKQMTITLPQDGNQVQVVHQVSNQGDRPIELAAWAITQMRPGGTAILPQNTELSDANGMQANRQLIFWPYSDLRSPHLQVGNRYVLLRSEVKQGAFKVGLPNPKGWLAYLNDGHLFVKQTDYILDARYPDFGASSQCYCNAEFLELETLSPLRVLAPGDSVSHRETWRIFEDIQLKLDADDFEDQIDGLIRDLGLFD